jgi:hypothetical protein
MKAFMLFLFYSCFLIVFSGIFHVVAASVAGTTSMVFAGTCLGGAVIAALFLGIFAAAYVPDVCVNQTTIEKIAGVELGTYNMGFGTNVKQVFGEKVWMWFLPIPPAIDGFLWSRIAMLEQSVRSDATV